MLNNSSIEDLKLDRNTKIKSSICILAIVFSFFPTGVLNYISLIENYLRIFQFLGLAFVIAYFLLSARRVIVTKGLFWCLIILVCESFTTLIRGGALFKALFEGIRFVGIIWMISNEGKNPQSKIYNYIKSFFYVMGFFSICFSFFSGIINTSIFGLAGELPNYIIPIWIILYLDFFKKSLLEKSLFIVFSLLSLYCLIFVIDSSTAKVGSVLIIFLLLFDRFIKKIDPKILVIIFLISFIAIVIFRITDYFGFLIEDVLQESITLHKRTYAWDYALELIQKSPIFGYGYIGKEFQYSIVYQYSNGWFAHPHDEILRLYLVGGLFNIIAVIRLMFIVANHLSRFYKEKSVRIITYALFTMLIMSIVETCYNSYFYLLIAFAFNSDSISIRYSDTKNEFEPENE